MRLARALPVGLLLLLVASACAKGPAAGSAPRTVTIDRGDAGVTVVLHVGDRLLTDLGDGPAVHWRVTHYPQALDLVTDDGEHGRFELAAAATGEGILSALTVDCGPPLLESDTGSQCPAKDEEPVDGVGGQFPLKVFRVTVRVV